MDPIATYSEVRFDGKRTFMLFPDRIYIRGKWTLKSDFEIDFPLVWVDPNYYRLNIRNSAFMAGIWMVVVSVVTCTILVGGFKMTLADNALLLVSGIGYSGLILSAVTFRKVEFLCFRNRGGGKVFDIARSGRQAKELDLFVDALIKQIKLVTAAT